MVARSITGPTDPSDRQFALYVTSCTANVVKALTPLVSALSLLALIPDATSHIFDYRDLLAAPSLHHLLLGSVSNSDVQYVLSHGAHSIRVLLVDKIVDEVVHPLTVQKMDETLGTVWADFGSLRIQSFEASELYRVVGMVDLLENCDKRGITVSAK